MRHRKFQHDADLVWDCRTYEIESPKKEEQFRRLLRHYKRVRCISTIGVGRKPVVNGPIRDLNSLSQAMSITC